MKRQLWILSILLVAVFPLGVLYYLYLLFIYNPDGTSIPTLKLVSYTHGTDSENMLVHFVGQYKGWRARISRWMGLAQESSLIITKEEVRITLSDASGVTHFVAPLRDVKATLLEQQKPVWSLWAGFFFIGAGLFLQFAAGTLSSITRSVNSYGGGYNNFSSGVEMPSFALWIAIIIGAAFLLNYYFSNRILVAITTNNLSQQFGIAFEIGSNLKVSSLMVDFQPVRQHIILAHNAETER